MNPLRFKYSKKKNSIDLLFYLFAGLGKNTLVRQKKVKYSRDKVMGCIVGGAIGDFLGAPYEGVTGSLEVEIQESSNIIDDTN